MGQNSASPSTYTLSATNATNAYWINDSSPVTTNPNIVKDGLVLNLDAGNPASYSGTGTVWKDLSGYGNDGTLLNGAGYSSVNSGSIKFDGINDRGTFASPVTPTAPQTYEVWVKGSPSSTTGDGFGYILHNNAISNSVASSYLTIGYAANTLQNKEIFACFNGTWATMGTGVIGDGTTVRQIVLTWNGTAQTAYIDGAQKVSQALATSLQNFYSVMAFGDSRGWTYRPITGDIYTIRIYNRALTLAEITQNFNALRGRYGI